jgi:hypothetical protein
MATSNSAPPAGSVSQQLVQRLGFLRERLNPKRPTSLPPRPPKGLWQTLQRGALGK